MGGRGPYEFGVGTSRQVQQVVSRSEKLDGDDCTMACIRSTAFASGSTRLKEVWFGPGTLLGEITITQLRSSLANKLLARLF